MGWYRTVNSIAILLGINLAVRLFNIPVTGNLLLGNHLVEAAAAFGIVSLGIDVGVIHNETKRKYLKVGLFAFFGGILFVAASFSSLFVFSEFMDITQAWFRIAPQVIFLIGIPTLYLADKLSERHKILGFENTGKRGLFNIFLVGVAWAVLIIYILNKYGWLML